MCEPYQEEVDNWEQQMRQELEPEWDGGECPFCGEMAHYFGGQFAECEECGKEFNYDASSKRLEDLIERIKNRKKTEKIESWRVT